MHGLGW